MVSAILAINFPGPNLMLFFQLVSKKVNFFSKCFAISGESVRLGILVECVREDEARLSNQSKKDRFT